MLLLHLRARPIPVTWGISLFYEAWKWRQESSYKRKASQHPNLVKRYGMHEIPALNSHSQALHFPQRGSRANMHPLNCDPNRLVVLRRRPSIRIDERRRITTHITKYCILLWVNRDTSTRKTLVCISHEICLSVPSLPFCYDAM